jgi:2-dehydro-3-deoxygalactonokinase
MTALIGIDWGSSNLRAFRYDAGGNVTERRSSPRGITTVAAGDFEAVLGTVIAGWSDAHVPVVLAGMVGSRNGMREVPYLPCPVDLAQLASAVTQVVTALGRCHIVPGVMVKREGAPAEVMRGEETQVLGSGVRDGTVVLPGTHSKWTRVERGRIVDFRTAMTGELFAILLGHSLLGRLTEVARDDHDAFELGARRALADPMLSMLLFSARAEVVTGGLPGSSVPSYLSGLLIGAEIGAMTRRDLQPTLIGDPTLCARYRRVFELADVGPVTIVEGDAATERGLWTIGRAVG